MKRLFLFVVIWGLMIGSAPLFSQVLMQDKVAFDNMNKLFSDRKAALERDSRNYFPLLKKLKHRNWLKQPDF